MKKIKYFELFAKKISIIYTKKIIVGKGNLNEKVHKKN
jgi:hypothetical protein